ncbi:BMP family ABC transporter substrate-binding protein [Dehalobacter sp. DCM]|uniref:BMP family lipoprotein n=1 Tax=Dehalobacter sp. DCM TaxID=2907827 RepID=UPI0030814499|nr:BMP family ABC transporter substrate-binding protein [Dehalobacter sp. DCM]
MMFPTKVNKPFWTAICLIIIGVMLFSGCSIGEKKLPSDEANYSIRVGLITSQEGVDDPAYQMAWEGLQKAEQELNAGIQFVAAQNEKDYPKQLADLKSKGCQVIFTIGNSATAAVLEAAKSNPKIKYICLDSSIDGQLPENVLAVTYRTEEAAFLAGYIAAKTTTSHVVGYIAGDNQLTSKPLYYGFRAGVRFVHPNCEILKGVAATYTNKNRVEEMTGAMLESQADVVFHTAGMAGKGMIEAMKDAGKYAIGSDVDQNDVAPETVLTSVIKENGQVAYDIIKQIEDNTLVFGKSVSYGLAENGVSLAEKTNTMLPEDTYNQLMAYQQKIIDGKITVPSNENGKLVVTN